MTSGRQDGWRGDSWRLVVHDTLPSTSDLCRTLAMAGAAPGLAVLAGRQTRGRGSRGRDWTSPAGNFHGSVLLRPSMPARAAGQWSLLAGVVVAAALAPFIPPGALQLKWPNDVLLHQAKVAGILVDSAARADGMLDWLVIGIGVNLTTAPEVPGRAVAAVAQFGRPPTPERFAHGLLAELARWQRRRHAEGFAAIRQAWLAHGPTVGSPVAFRVAETTLAGRFAGLGEEGELSLEIDGLVRRFGTGEILL